MFINTYSNHYQQTIDHFHGAYAFLSNFYPSRIYYRGYWYANNEAAFQAQKTLSPKEQLQFTKLRNPKMQKTGKRSAAPFRLGKSKAYVHV